MGHIGTVIKCVAHAGHRIVDENRLYRFAGVCETADRVQGLLATGTTFTIAEHRTRRSVYYAISVAEYLNTFSDCFRRVRLALNDFATKAEFGGDKNESVCGGRRRNAIRTLSKSSLHYDCRFRRRRGLWILRK